MKKQEVIFKVTELIDPVGSGSSLEVGKTYKGYQSDNTVFFDDVNGKNWCFYVGKTCEIVNVSKFENDNLKLDIFHSSDVRNFTFNINFNGNLISGVLYTTTAYKPQEYQLITFEEVKGYDWYYYSEVDEDYIKDLRTDEQKEIENLLLTQFRESFNSSYKKPDIDIFQNTDVLLLQEQKDFLVSLIATSTVDDEKNHLEGILHLMDAISDKLLM